MSDISAKASNVLQTNGCLKVSSKSSPASVAGAIAGMMKDGVPVEIQSVGAGAVNQAVKAIAISRGFLSPVGIEIVCVPLRISLLMENTVRLFASRWNRVFLLRLITSRRASPLNLSRGKYDEPTF